MAVAHYTKSPTIIKKEAEKKAADKNKVSGDITDNSVKPVDFNMFKPPVAEKEETPFEYSGTTKGLFSGLDRLATAVGDRKKG